LNQFHQKTITTAQIQSDKNKLNQRMNKTESNRKEETRTKILIFEDLHAPSSKPEL